MSRARPVDSRILSVIASLSAACLFAPVCGCAGDDGSGIVADGAVVGQDAMADATSVRPDARPSDCDGLQPHCLDATHVETCVGGNVASIDCASASQTCQVDGSGGAQCADPPSTGASVVSGKVEYQDREPQPSGALGSLRILPARGVSVSIVRESDGAVLVTGRTFDDGTYVLHHDIPAGTMVHVLAATTSNLSTRPVQCVNPDSSNHVYGLASPAFATAATVTQNLRATEVSGLAEAFNIFDQLVVGIDTVRLRMGVTSLQPVAARWARSDWTNNTYYDGALELLGSAADDDGYDDAVILHEFGHYVETIYGAFDSPGGPHAGEAVNPLLGWSEGWSTYFSSAARANAFYMDSNSGGGFGDDLENTVVKGQASGPMTQDMSEETVAEVLWDIGDGPANDDDPRAPGDRHEDIFKVETLYLHTLSGGRGVTGVDLVDWLDGWFKLEGTSTCAAVRNIVVTVHAFPYDFNAPGAACP